ncbi:DUF3077 domain-containing protein [Pseudomonas fulva]|uniref:DUF3077 domain-containing protein n=1 Tax=Pseudomonas TaxID=286 RepID=UPI0004814269|nr:MULTISPECIES: DUF3077 domain-containing protein [unclassified Pseudomonas]MBH3363702.1 DUF3077 domain-containing protein [Pseudomonas sp. URMO17WK12:I11]PZW48865.1 hypothetical protein F478_03815 [Pseudomonas sp. URIL14HWK12:I2]PZW58371.1 hypothetical protein F477_01711 [Pseudomonas sp. URIL14HWK12:I3]RDL20269.1 hypothetical protein F633_02174 [Pseudomonas sp. LAMO17WK12:I3]RED09218.1 hypothetical protein D884_02427 [Pseudomonas sp. URMO17WK12:I10]
MAAHQTGVTAGKTKFYQGKQQTEPLFCIEPGIPCEHARAQASELMGYVQELTISGLMDENPKLVWAAYYLGALAKTLMDDADAGMAN